MNMKDELDFFDNYKKESLKNLKKVIFNEFRSYKYKRTRELLTTWIFTILVLIFSEPIIALNINLLNNIGYSLYLPIFTVETVVLPIMVGKGIEKIINHKSNTKEGIFNKIKDEVIYESNIKFSETLFKTMNDIYDKKEIILPLSISNMTKEELIDEINKIISKDVIKENNKELRSLDSFYLFSVIMLSNLPLALFQPIFGTIGLGTLNNTFILKLIFLLMGILISKMEADRYNADLKAAINGVKKVIGGYSKFDKEDLNTLFKAYQIKMHNNILENDRKEKEKNNSEVKILDKKPTIQRIAPKVVDYEFKGNPEEKRNAKVLKRER